MKEVFTLVYNFLKWLSRITGLTYHEVNIVIYYILIPSIFIIILDKIFNTNWLKIGFGLLVVLTLFFVPNFEKFATMLFYKSVDFLNGFQALGLDYVQASVVICVIAPLIFIFLLVYLKRQRA